MKKRITVLIDEELYKKLKDEGVSAGYALKVGAEVLLNLDAFKEINAKIRFLEQKIENLSKMFYERERRNLQIEKTIERIEKNYAEIIKRLSHVLFLKEVGKK